MAYEWNIYRITDEGRYGEIVNSFTDFDDAIVAASNLRTENMFRGKDVHFAVGNGLISIYNTEVGHLGDDGDRTADVTHSDDKED